MSPSRCLYPLDHCIKVLWSSLYLPTLRCISYLPNPISRLLLKSVTVCAMNKENPTESLVD